MCSSGRSAAATIPQIDTAWSLYYAGKSVTARQGLEDYLAAAEVQDPKTRPAVFEALLEICIRSLSDDCLVKQAWAYAAVAEKIPVANDLQRLELARRAGYYIRAAQLARGSPETVAGILQGGDWKHEHAYDVELYLRRQVLASNIQLRLGKPLEASRSIDKVLSLIAAIKTPRDAAPTVIWALSDVMESLLAVGDTERAYGLFRATSAAVGAALPPLSVDAAVYELRAGLLLQEVGRDDDAQRVLDAAVATLDRIELDPQARRRLLASALNAKAASCIVEAKLDCARAALARHPFAELYASPGRAPAAFDEVAYLTVRAMAAGLGQTADPVAAGALKAPPGFRPDAVEGETLPVYRAIGLALSLPPGKARQGQLLDAGRRIRDVARRPQAAPFGAWYRSGSLDQAFFRLALTQAEAAQGQDGADVAFILLQLAGRRGQSFDADALTALGQGRDPLQRRAVHQALRLRARRDALERASLQTVAQQMLAGPATGAAPQHDVAARMVFRDYAQRLDAASKGLAADGVSGSGTNLVTLRQLQAVLAPDEAALVVAPAVGGLAYMCVRRDSTFRRVAPIDPGSSLLVDSKLVQAALTAGHAPSEALDAQFPVAASVRLYELLIRPFAPCLKPGDQILWLPNLTTTAFPLAALLEQAPPKLGAGWDLSQAAWLARSHAISYAGSASVVVAARTAPRPPPAAFDFLGVGDPEFSGVTASGEDRARIVLRGVRSGGALATLPALPETQDELERSAKGFRSARILVEDAATEGGFRRELGAYRYLSFATHGLLRDDLQGLSEPALALTPVSGAQASDDGLLTAPEIADLNLSARFVALSACNTANFDLTRMSQDLPALASAFAVAGVPATLGTLWPVESETGKQVVAATFEQLRAGRGAAAALAQAQRAFLAAPPSQAYLHPRFWAPFVILGDGGAPSAAPPEPALRLQSAERLPDGAGEVLQIRRTEGAVLARFSAPRDAKGRRAGATSAATPAGPLWRRASDDVGSEPFLAEMGAHVVVGGKVVAGPARIFPALESLDKATGAPVAAWRGDALADPVALVLAGARVDERRAVFGVVTVPLRGPAGKARPKLYVYEVGPSLAPRRLFEVESPSAQAIERATFTPLGEALLVTYSARAASSPATTPGLTDDFERTDCGPEAMTRVELRDLASGALRAEAELRGHLIAAALARPDGEVWLGGSAQAACAEARATVLALDAKLGQRRVYRDASLGASDVRTLSALPDGRVFVAASKDNVVGYQAPREQAQPAEADVHRALYGAMALLLGRDGAASTPVLLDAGASLFVTSSDASDPADILLGGAIADAPVVFHLSARLPAPGAVR